jgi:hypothetical protein
LSWKLQTQDGEIVAKRNQADKALLSVVKICIALYHESFFLEGLSDGSISRLKQKFKKRPGNLVQIGFGLHAGRAVEGAIGSERKLDATYLSEAVELSEYLESSTKKYGVNILMSGKFYCLLNKSVKKMCRKIDHIFFTEEYEEDDPNEQTLQEEQTNDNHMSLHTFDMDIDVLFNKKTQESRSIGGLDIVTANKKKSNRSGSFGSFSRNSDDRSRSITSKLSGSILRHRMSIFGNNSNSPSIRRNSKHKMDTVPSIIGASLKERKLEIPNNMLLYKLDTWHKGDLKAIRIRFNPSFYEKFDAGYQAYIKGQWKKAKALFEKMVDQYQDKPSIFLLEKMEESNYVIPRNFDWQYHALSSEYH